MSGWAKLEGADHGELEVKNAGSTARDHLANERTFLAWLRTSISLVALGLAIGKFSPGRTGFATGMAFIGLGAVFLFYSGRRYFSVLDALERGQFRINKRGIKVVMLLVGLIALGCALVILLEATQLSGYAAGYGACSSPCPGPTTRLTTATRTDARGSAPSQRLALRVKWGASALPTPPRWTEDFERRPSASCVVYKSARMFFSHAYNTNAACGKVRCTQHV